MLPPHARIGLIAPSHRFFAEPYAAGQAWLASLGFQLVELGLTEPHRYFAASDQQRLNALVEALSRPDLDAVWAIRGGSGVTRLLPAIPWDTLQPRPLIGFSDLTPLLDAWARLGHPAVHGPVVHSLGRTDPQSLAHLARLLTGQPVEPLVGRVFVEGRATGPLVGGNLCMLASTCGTKAQLDAAGAIVILEEIGEQPYKVDRMLEQLKQAGVFDGAVGIALGQFTRCTPPDGADWTLADVLREQLAPLNLPIVADLPIGHGARNHAFPVRAPGWIRGGRLGWSAPAV